MNDREKEGEGEGERENLWVESFRGGGIVA